jgi:hypothetical protein
MKTYALAGDERYFSITRPDALGSSSINNRTSLVCVEARLIQQISGQFRMFSAAT